MTFRIARADVFPLRFELGEKRYGSSRGLVPARETTLVRLETRDGAVGWGESFGPGTAVVPLVREVLRDLVEREVDGPVPFVTRNALQNYHRGGGLHSAAALSGVRDGAVGRSRTHARCERGHAARRPRPRLCNAACVVRLQPRRS